MTFRTLCLIFPAAWSGLPSRFRLGPTGLCVRIRRPKERGTNAADTRATFVVMEESTGEGLGQDQRQALCAALAERA
jgi:hypothetical protein